MTAYIAATLPPPSIDPRLRKHDPPTATAQHSVAGGLGDTTGPTPRRLSTFPSTDALAGDSSWNPRRHRHAVPTAQRSRHKKRQHTPRRSNWPQRDLPGRDVGRGHRPARGAIGGRSSNALSPLAGPSHVSSWRPACYPYALANGMRASMEDLDIQCLRRSALIAQGIEHRFPKPCVAGSNPAGGTTSDLRNRRLVALSAGARATVRGGHHE
jgi:hypothetical protein